MADTMFDTVPQRAREGFVMYYRSVSVNTILNRNVATRLKLSTFVMMMLFSVLLGVDLIGCGYRYVEKALVPNNKISIVMRAAEDVNLYDATPHGIVTSIYELNNIGLLAKFESEGRGFSEIEKSLESEKEARQIGRYTMVPGESMQLEFGLVTESKYLFIVAGYFKKNKFEEFTRLYDLKRYQTITPMKYFYEDLDMAVDIKLGSKGLIKE